MEKMGRPDLAIHCTDLRMNYGALHVLDGVNLEVPRGQVVALLGPNGAGKTTTVDPTAYLTEVLTTQPGEVEVIEVRAASLEDAYLDLVRRAEAGENLSGVTAFTGGTR